MTASDAERHDTVASAMDAVDRARYLPGADPVHSRTDRSVVTAKGAGGLPSSSSSPPSMTAAMARQLAVRPGDRVLEIGTGSGYNAAVLATLTGPTGSVVTIECEPHLATAAAQRLLHLPWVQVRTGDGAAGAPLNAPFDRVIAKAGVSRVPTAWLAQLRPGGTLVAPVWLGPGLELSAAFVRVEDGLVGTGALPCSFPPLRGPHGGQAQWLPMGRNRFAVTAVSCDARRTATLRELMAQPPSWTSAPDRSHGWSARLALERSDAIQVVDLGVPQTAATGLVNLGPRPGLAVVDGDRVCWAGSISVLERLFGVLKRLRPVDVSQLRVDVAADGCAVPGPVP